MSRRSLIFTLVVAGLAGAIGWCVACRFSQEAASALARKPNTVAEDFETLHRGLRISGYLRDEVIARGGSSIPVLVPWEMTRDEEAARTFRFELKISHGGYTALFGDETLDYVINGTSHGYRRSDADGDEDPEQDDPGHEGGEYMMPYEDFDDGRGGSLSFGFRGADYQVELYCLAEAPDPRANCLVAGDVEAFVQGLKGGGEPASLP